MPLPSRVFSVVVYAALFCAGLGVAWVGSAVRTDQPPRPAPAPAPAPAPPPADEDVAATYWVVVVLPANPDATDSALQGDPDIIAAAKAAGVTYRIYPAESSTLQSAKWRARLAGHTRPVAYTFDQSGCLTAKTKDDVSEADVIAAIHAAKEPPDPTPVPVPPDPTPVPPNPVPVPVPGPPGPQGEPRPAGASRPARPPGAAGRFGGRRHGPRAGRGEGAARPVRRPPPGRVRRAGRGVREPVVRPGRLPVGR